MVDLDKLDALCEAATGPARHLAAMAALEAVPELVAEVRELRREKAHLASALDEVLREDDDGQQT